MYEIVRFFLCIPVFQRSGRKVKSVIAIKPGLPILNIGPTAYRPSAPCLMEWIQFKGKITSSSLGASQGSIVVYMTAGTYFNR